MGNKKTAHGLKKKQIFSVDAQSITSHESFALLDSKTTTTTAPPKQDTKRDDLHDDEEEESNNNNPASMLPDIRSSVNDAKETMQQRILGWITNLPKNVR